MGKCKNYKIIHKLIVQANKLPIKIKCRSLINNFIIYIKLENNLINSNFKFFKILELEIENG